MRRSKPLQIWDQNVRNGHIKRITDPDIASSVLEIMGTNVSTNFITCPLDPKKTLAIKLPFLVMIIKNVSSRAYAALRLAADNGRLNIQISRPLFVLLAEEVLHVRGPGAGRQGCAQTVQSLQLPEHHQSQALHLHHAHEAR